MDIPTPTEAGENQSLDRAAKRLLKDKELSLLVKRWRDVHVEDVELRLATGKLLNKHLGNPNTRQTRGKGVLEEVCKRLQISVSDASRFRKFAHLFRSADDLKKRFPDVVSWTWTRVRDLLPKLDSNGELKSDAQAKPDNQEEIPTFDGFLQSLSDLSLDVAEVESQPDDDEVKDLIAASEDLAAAISDRFNVQVSVAEGPEVVSPDSSVRMRAA